MTDRQRRDPRSERAARLGKVEAPVPAAGVEFERVRRDPRALRGGTRLREICNEADARRQDVFSAPSAGPADTSSDVRRIEDPRCLILAVPDLEDGRFGLSDHGLVSAARVLAQAHDGAVVVIAIDAVTGRDLGALGADRVVRVSVGGYAPEARAAAVVASIEALAPRHVVFCDTPTGGGDVGRRVAAWLGERPATTIHRLDTTRVTRSGGSRLDFTGAPPRILLVLPEAAAPVNKIRREARPMEPPAFDRSTRLEDGGMLAVDPEAVPLAEAPLICSGGNGVTDWVAFREVSAALGATCAGSRVVCDAGLIPRDRQVGASGTLVEARCYLAFGISGAPQHLQGIARCEHVVAVNTDPHAPIVKRADLAIIADAQAVMRALTCLIAEHRNGTAGRGD